MRRAGLLALLVGCWGCGRTGAGSAAVERPRDGAAEASLAENDADTVPAPEAAATETGDAAPASPGAAGAAVEQAAAWACPLGPIVAAAAFDPRVPAGRYDLAFTYRQEKYPTMERYMTQTHVGRAELTLSDDGTFEGCLGMTIGSYGSVSEYESPDGERHVHRDERRQLQWMAGRWEQAADGVRLVLERVAWNTCRPTPDAPPSPVPAWQLVCGMLEANDKLPVRALACRAMQHLPWLEEAGLDLGDGARAGPWSLRLSPGPLVTGDDWLLPCGPWVLFGAAPGLTVESADGPRDERPVVTFTAGAAPFEPAAFLPDESSP
ncbi:MAG: hypothetical protein JXB32_09030 [Deltaproteobacteria bacterium]|nr:hypothetical protein [Deltaproteobacteria bacterium]